MKIELSNKERVFIHNLIMNDTIKNGNYNITEINDLCLRLQIP